MTVKFDRFGNLYPYKKIEMSLSEFESTFVKHFDSDSNRHLIFENYLNYLSDFKKQITPDFTHWINGSFVSNKQSPGDIDFVNIVDSETVFKKKELIENNFINAGVLKKYQIDAYLVIQYPETHSHFIRTQSDLLYWNDWFSKTKMNNLRKRFPKGFVEIKFN